MKYVFSSLVALGLVASALGLTTAQAETSNASNSWPSRAKLVCWTKKGFTEVAAPVAVWLAERRHLLPRTAFRMHGALLWQSHYGPSATASCEWL
jgi:hypothetical protein